MTKSVNSSSYTRTCVRLTLCIVLSDGTTAENWRTLLIPLIQWAVQSRIGEVDLFVTRR